MKTLLGVYPLQNRLTGEFEDAELYMPLDQKNADDFETEWLPVLNSRVANLSADENHESANVQDLHWEWRNKIKERTGRMDFVSYAVECNGVTQGMMSACNCEFVKEPSQLGQFLIYIDLIASAPWNRRGFTENRLYKGVGELLLGTAISYSINEGFNGRIGLHSLPQSEFWYSNVCGMTDLGIDLNHPQSLRLFEMTEEQAQSYISTS
ncbi:hypothetical protein MNBD_GAMMA12-1355 [hydrothermal vent metagenome]|uniref:N-acetyltransferase domain-containing protein n=1 Tax=hydrothermal vent metagenome TaxID=652676 RepID=A0A3B0Z522_9ZZZZ